MDKNVYATITGVPMGFEAFVEAMRERLQDRYPDCNIRVGHADKNNGVHLTGIVILPEGQNAAPNIYMESFYSDYLAGRRMEDLADAAARFYEGNKLQEDFTLPDMTDFEAVKDLICFRPVNGERNREKLKSMPHRDFLDLAVIYFVPVDIGPGKDCRASITMMDAHAAKWAVDSDTLFSIARANTERLFPSVLQPMEEIIQGMCPGLSVHETSLHVLRNNGGGAAALLNEGVLREFAEKHGDFYIFPSSVHEVILYPLGQAEMMLEKEDASAMVRDVNRAQVASDEILADHAYLYHADTGETEILS